MQNRIMLQLKIKKN